MGNIGHCYNSIGHNLSDKNKSLLILHSLQLTSDDITVIDECTQIISQRRAAAGATLPKQEEKSCESAAPLQGFTYDCGSDMTAALGGAAPGDGGGVSALMPLGEGAGGGAMWEGLGVSGGGAMLKPTSCSQEMGYMLNAERGASTANENIAANERDGGAEYGGVGEELVGGVEHFSEDEERDADRDAERDRQTPHTRKQRQPLRLQVLGGEHVVVKNEGVQDGDGLFEMDERGNTAHQPAYAQGSFYEDSAVFSGGFWPQADPQASLGSNPRGRVTKPPSPPPMLFQFSTSESQQPSFFVGGPMVIDSLAESCQQAPPPASLTPAPPPSTPACLAGPSFAPQGSETSFDCSHCGKSLRSRKNYSKHMFIHSVPNKHPHRCNQMLSSLGICLWGSSSCPALR
uniref:C2H2-type domain-containing protein n=1 Tax=Sinocyclocheilus anshuiensis TaxID=1608454 RepID=A0A671REU8_9TELE